MLACRPSRVRSPSDLEWSFHSYDSPTQDLVESDLVRLEREQGRGKRKREGEGQEGAAASEAAARLAAVIRFELPSSCYATMLVRELCKQGTSLRAQMALNA